LTCAFNAVRSSLVVCCYVAASQHMDSEARVKEPLVESARRQCDDLCNLVKEPSTKLDLKNRLANVERPFKDLQKKLGTT